MAGALQQQADGHLDRYIVIHDQYSCQSKKFSGLRWNQVNGRLRVLPNPRIAATASPAGTFRLGRQKARTKRRYTNVAGQTIRSGLRQRTWFARACDGAATGRKDQLLRYSG